MGRGRHGKQLKADYVLEYRNMKLGVVEAKASTEELTEGVGQAMILTLVINKAFFGWTIELRYPLDVLAGTPLWIIPAAITAAWLPSRRASRIPPRSSGPLRINRFETDILGMLKTANPLAQRQLKR